ncbi:pyridoxamine 5'-phosphate oxidase family protein [Actinoplanes sp. NPDC051861]|uniref:pyridoxamine 5'-phosphate oxidase family protein n=1 Tax=Actinoplanes sp. NPDC051861 TaxID=3155170 RepID=UPI0034167E74
MDQSAIDDVLNRPLSQELLSRDLARMAFIALDGTPRSIPIGIVWNGTEIVMCTATNARKLPALRRNPAVALTIDTESHPPRVLLLRGQAELDPVDGIPDEYFQWNGTYEMTPEQRAEWEVGRAGALRRHGPDRGETDLGQTDRLRDHHAHRDRGTHAAQKWPDLGDDREAVDV